MGPAPASPSSRHDARLYEERGAALVVTVMVSALALTLGMAFLVLGETESLRSKAWSERAQATAAARDGLDLAASWFTAPVGALPPMPGPDEWTASDDWRGWPLQSTAGADRLRTSLAQAKGSESSPDLALEHDAPFLEALSQALSEDRLRGVVVERVCVHASPIEIGGQAKRTAGLGISVTVSVRRGPLRVARTTVSGRVSPLPSLASPDVVAAGGDVVVERGGRVAWGRVESGGAVRLPPTDDEAFPWSGLPRQRDGSPTSFAPGGAVDWNMATPWRECVLSELCGCSRAGAWVKNEVIVPPTLPDPWVSVAAGSSVLVGDDAFATAGALQPRPFDPRRCDLRHDLSHVSAGWAGRADALPQAVESVESIAAALASQAPGVRRFVLDPRAGGSEEPAWREGGQGPARTAAEWVGGPVAEAGIFVFATGGAAPPERVTLEGGRGLVLVEARRLVLAAPASSPRRIVHAPGEPFIDTGIDADGDGEIDPGTAGNGRWDRDVDDDGESDAGEPMAWRFESQALPRWRLPSGDSDPARLDSMPHEAFLNLDYPEDAADLDVRVDFRAGLDAPGRQVRDLDGDGVVRPGIDRVTGIACDEEGALLEMPLGFEGVVLCRGGDVIVADGCAVFGSVRATGDVVVSTGARVLFDDGLRRDGVPSGVAIATGTLRDVRAGAGSPRRGPAPPDAVAEAGDERSNAAPATGASSERRGSGADDAPGGRPTSEGGGLRATRR